MLCEHPAGDLTRARLRLRDERRAGRVRRGTRPRSGPGRAQPPRGERRADLWPVGYANDEIGYLCTDRSYVEGGYEPGAYVYYGRPAPFKGEEALIVETAARLLRDA